MTVLSAIQQACPRLGLAVPSAVFASTDRDAVELARLANVAARRIARAHPWQALKREATITGDGSTEDFDFEDDYHWIPGGNELWSSAFQRPLRQITDENTWLGLTVQSSSFIENVWTIYADQIHIKNALDTDVTAKYFYQSRNWAVDAGDDPIAAFSADDDTFVLDEDLLCEAIIYLWKQDKGGAYAQYMDDYAGMLEQEIGREKGPRRMAVGRARIPAGVKRSWPGVLGG